MRLFHLGNAKYARQLTGEGARLFGGRWNLKGDPCIYTSGTRSLCLLEYAANVSLYELPPNLAMTEFALPDALCKQIELKALPKGWEVIPAQQASKQFGSGLLADKDVVCFAVPSTIVSAEMNFILNPLANAFDQLKIVATESFTFDVRIKQ